MNLFFINQYLEGCALEACDKHVVKMILETAQLLYSAWWCRSGNLPPSELQPYRKTHINHPMSIWVRESKTNYQFACYYGLLLCHEYTQRYGKYHKTEAHIRQLYQWGFPPLELEIPPAKNAKPIDHAYHDVPHGIQSIPLCMGKEYYIRDENNNLLGVESYRNYYMSKQNNFSMTWKNKEHPQWFKSINNVN